MSLRTRSVRENPQMIYYTNNDTGMNNSQGYAGALTPGGSGECHAFDEF